MAGDYVVFVPGFGGSSLNVEKPDGSVSKTVWYSWLELGTNGPDNLDLAADGNGPGPLAKYKLTPFGDVGWQVYDSAFYIAKQLGYQARFFSYDWRRSTAANAQRFFSWLAANIGDAHFYVIGHSLGGLVARLAYPLWYAKTGGTGWLRTIYLGTPHGGTYDCTGALAGWTPPNTLLYVCATAIGLVIRRAVNQTASISPLQSRYNQVLASWPSLYEMSPTAAAPYAGLDPAVRETQDVQNYATWNPNITQAQLDAGVTLQNQLAAQLTQPRPSECCVVGTGLWTPRSVADPSQFGVEAGYNYTLDGDGCVTVDRGTLPGLGTLTVQSDHQSIPRSAAFLNQLESLLLNGIPTNESVPPITPAVPIKGALVLPPQRSTIQFPQVLQRIMDP